MSGLDRKLQTCVGGAWIFSGRPDPTWQVKDSIAKRLIEIWDSLETFRGQGPSPPSLGYRGCFLRCLPDEEWVAYKGVVTRRKGDTSESRRDANRKLERLLLASAPKSALPPLLDLLAVGE